MKSLILFFLLSLNSIAWSGVRDSSDWIISYNFSMTKMDFFTGFQGLKTINNWSLGLGLETGVNRTFFQQRFYPKIQLITNYTFVRKSWIRMFASGNYGFSFCKVNQLSNATHFWNEWYCGLGFEFGKRIRPYINASAGLLQEAFMGNNEARILRFNTMGFQGTIGLRYAF
jgi:hypothetical protein